MTDYEIVITIIQFGLLFGLFYSVYLTRREFMVRTRPYIGFSGIAIKDSDKEDEIEFDVIVNNVGNLPAKNAKLYGKFIITGEGEIPFECETKGSVFPLPDQSPSWIIGAKDVNRDAILSGAIELKLEMTVDYYGVSKDVYHTSTSRVYDPQRKTWISESGDWV